MDKRAAVNTELDRSLWNVVKKGAEFSNLTIDSYLEKVLFNLHQDEDVQRQLFEAFKRGIKIDEVNEKKKVNINISKVRWNFLSQGSAIEGFSTRAYLEKIIREFFKIYYDEIIDSFYDNFRMAEGSNLLFDQKDLKRELGEIKTISTVVDEGAWNRVRKLAFLYEIKISKLLDLIVLWYSREHEEDIRRKMGFNIFE